MTTPPAQASLPTMMLSAREVTADGTSSVQLSVSRPERVAVTLTAERGTWADSGTTVTTLPTGSGSAELVTCDARTTEGCAGTVRITASGESLTAGAIAVQFLSPEVCGNARDDDGDGKQDCADPDCQGEACTLSGTAVGTGVCGPGLTCVCATGQTERCDNGVDDDCDGVADCADLDCQPTASSPGASCTLAGATGTQCSASGVCSCPGGEAQESSCGDGADNDCDGQVDCLDSDCAGDACGADGVTCTASTPSTCSCPTGSDEVCNDGVDNNCDGKVDCEDGACGGEQCKSTGGASWVCSGSPGSPGVCEDTATSLAIAASAERVRLPADGAATTRVTATLLSKGAPLVGKSVQFSIASGPGALVAPTSAVTDADGQASVTFSAGATAGSTRIVASYDTGAASVGVITQAVSVAQVAVGQVELVSTQFPLMGVRSSSFQESNELVFRVLDTQGLPFPDGLVVTATHPGLGRELTSYVGETPANCAPATRLCTASAVTGEGSDPDSGLVKVLLHSGSAAGALSVKLTAAAGGRSASTVAANIAVVGAKAFGQNLSISCDPKNVPALTEHDCSKSFVDATITCRVALADRFHNVLGVPQLVDFRSEAGAASLPAQSSASGEAIGTVLTNGFAIPVDVTPDVGEYALAYADKCGFNTHNPRDGVVSVLASVYGEEGFVDGSNGHPANGFYDLGEKFVDQGEPFVDANDNNTRDGDEQYVDVNGNGTWDGPNGTWDSDTLIWAETRVTYTGEPNVVAVDNPAPQADENAATRWYQVGSPHQPTVQPTFSVLASRTGPPEVKATSDYLGLFYTDANFNPPSDETSFSLEASEGISAEFVLSPVPQDYRGHVLTQQYCDATSGSGCASECLSERCVRKSTVKGFLYGSYGEVKVTGGSEPVGPVRVQATSELRGHTLLMGVSGTSN